jgi:hypothetical protein
VEVEVHADAGPLHVEAEAALATKADLDRYHRRLAACLEPPRGKYEELYATGRTGSGFSGSGPIAFAFAPAAPPPGRLWLIQWVAIWVGTNPAVGAVASLFAAVMVGQSPAGAGTPGAVATSVTPNLTDVRIPGQAVPAAVNVPDKTIVKPQQQFYILLGGLGLAASTVYNASAGVLDLPETAEAILW